jgi:hypothetical protein
VLQWILLRQESARVRTVSSHRRRDQGKEHWRGLERRGRLARFPSAAAPSGGGPAALAAGVDSARQGQYRGSEATDAVGAAQQTQGGMEGQYCTRAASGLGRGIRCLCEEGYIVWAARIIWQLLRDIEFAAGGLCRLLHPLLAFNNTHPSAAAVQLHVVSNICGITLAAMGGAGGSTT